MNFDYSADARALKAQASELFASASPPAHLHALLDSGRQDDPALWATVSGLGWAGPQVDEELGGVGAEPQLLCALAEAVGGALAPVPFMSSAILAVEGIRLAGSKAQQEALLPPLAAGEVVATAALWDAQGHAAARVAGGRLTGRKTVVSDGMTAALAIVIAADETGAQALYAVQLDAAQVTRQPLLTLDLLRGHAQVDFNGAPAERLDGRTDARVVDDWLDRVAIYMAFEQLGGAQACLDMAVAYAKERVAFGRPIGSFQGIKHKLADIYVAVELARSNCYFAASELQGGAASLAIAASAARQAATAAYELAAKENIQTHGGFGFTWDADCHLHYRRSRALSVALGHPSRWRDRLVDALAAQ